MSGRRRAAATVLAAALFLPARPAVALQPNFIGAADFLSLEASARLSGTAGSLAADPLGPLGVFTSPASTLATGPPLFSASYVRGLMDTTYGFVGGSFASETGTSYSAGISYDRTDNVRVIRPGELPQNDAQVSDMEIVAAVARRSNPAYAFGFGVKGFDSRLIDTESVGAAVDVDFLMTPEVASPLRLQLSMRNLGYASAHASASALTSVSAAIAAALPIEVMDGQRLTLGFLLLRPIDSTLPFDLAAGVEYALRAGVAFRAGYRTGALLNHVTLGAGLHVSTGTLDYAFVPFAELGVSHRLSVTFAVR